MAKKIKRNPEMDDLAKRHAAQLEDVGEERAFEIELDEETQEVIFVYHYRRKFGDDFDADIEHGMVLEEVFELTNTLIQMMEELKKLRLAQVAATVVEKPTIDPVEKNPMKDNPTQ